MNFGDMTWTMTMAKCPCCKSHLAYSSDNNYNTWKCYSCGFTMFKQRKEQMMTKEKAIDLLDNLIGMVEDNQESDYDTALKMGIQALSQEPCDVSVSEKEPNEITEEVTLRFFKNTLKVRWHDFVIYNVEWLKKHWQMEMDIVCGVKPCDDAVSREFIEITTHYPPSETCIYPEYKGKPYYSIKYCENGKTIVGYGTYSIEVLTRYLKEYFLPSVTRQTGEWTDVGLTGEMYVRNCKCTNCGKWNIGSPLELPAYCGICGAKMTSDKYMLYGAEPYKAESEVRNA